MSDLETAVRWSKRFEGILKDHHGATGKGLHELVSSVEKKLDADVVRKLRMIATVRNKIVHEDDYTRIDNRKAFKEACSYCRKKLEPRSFLPWIITGVVLVIAGVVAFLVFRG